MYFFLEPRNISAAFIKQSQESCPTSKRLQKFSCKTPDGYATNGVLYIYKMRKYTRYISYSCRPKPGRFINACGHYFSHTMLYISGFPTVTHRIMHKNCKLAQQRIIENMIGMVWNALTGRTYQLWAAASQNRRRNASASSTSARSSCSRCSVSDTSRNRRPSSSRVEGTRTKTFTWTQEKQTSMRAYWGALRLVRLKEILR